MTKKFNKLEKEFIKLIVEKEGYQRNILNMLDKFLKDSLLEFVKEDNEIYLRGGSPETLIDKINEISPVIVILTGLVRYLEKEGYVSIYCPLNNAASIVTVGQGVSNKCRNRHKFSDDTVAKNLIHYVHKEIFPSFELEQLVSNNFVTDIEVRFLRQQVTTWTSIILAGIIGIGGIFYQIYDRAASSSANLNNVNFIKNQIVKLNTNFDRLVVKSGGDVRIMEKTLHSFSRTVNELFEYIKNRDKLKNNINRLPKKVVPK